MKMDCSKLQFEISIDGKFVWDAWCHRPRYHGNGSVWEEIISGMKLGKGRGCEIKDFKFMGLKTSTYTLINHPLLVELPNLEFRT